MGWPSAQIGESRGAAVSVSPLWVLDFRPIVIHRRINLFLCFASNRCPSFLHRFPSSVLLLLGCALFIRWNCPSPLVRRGHGGP